MRGSATSSESKIDELKASTSQALYDGIDENFKEGAALIYGEGQDKVYMVTSCLDLVVLVKKQRERTVSGQCYGYNHVFCRI